MLATISHTARAQDTVPAPPCSSPCPGDSTPWKYEEFDATDWVTSICGTNSLCKVNIKYRYRGACGNCDVWIDEISLKKDTACKCSDSQRVKDAITILLLSIANGQSCTVDNSRAPRKCLKHINLFSGMCANWKYDPQYGMVVVSCCPGALCCGYGYEVCTSPDKNGRYSDIVRSYPIGPNGNPDAYSVCNPDIYTDASTNCFPFCGFFPEAELGAINKLINKKVD